ncbi:unnamed protein product [Closterium sp. NIES-64]|nr:unnamed protein product [Closterium sp. NIES-64]
MLMILHSRRVLSARHVTCTLPRHRRSACPPLTRPSLSSLQSLARLFPRPSPLPSSTWLALWQHREHAHGRVLLGETGHMLTAALVHHTAVHGCDDDVSACT